MSEYMRYFEGKSYTQKYPAIDGAAFSNDLLYHIYWSSTTSASALLSTWVMDFRDGNIGFFLKTGNEGVRCLRDLNTKK